MFLRSFYKDSHNLTPAVALMEQAKIYPLGGQATAKPMQYPDASGVPVNMLPASDGKAFEQLKQLVDVEGDSLADPDWRGMLASIGIVRGQPFNPDASARAILNDAARIGYKMSRVIGFEILSAAARFASIRTATGSTLLPTERPQIPAARSTWPGTGLMEIISTSMRGSGSSLTTIRSVPV